MAHVGTVGALTEELVHLITRYSPTEDAAAFADCHDAALRGLRHHRFGRTNQFNVNASLNGLVEKLRVRNSERVGDALAERLKRLVYDAEGHKPEVLSLILSLSERPVENARIEDLERSTPPPTPHALLRWEDIVKDDPLTEQDIWDDIDRAADSSEDELSLPSTRAASEDACDTGSTSASDEHLFDLQSLIVPADESALSQIEHVQAWRKPTQEVIELTEIQLIREVFHTLRGLPSSVFRDAERTGALKPKRNVAIPDCSQSVIQSVLERVAELASNVNPLRLYTQSQTRKPTLQAFKEKLCDEIHSFDRHLAQLERTLVSPDKAVVVSIMRVVAEIEHSSPVFPILNRFVSEFSEDFSEYSYHLLDDLLNAASDSQLVGEAVVYEKLGSMFCNCLNTYLRSIHIWMTEGLIENRHDDFFVRSAEHTVPSPSFWHDRFDIRRAGNGIAVPQLLQPFIKAIFSVGKSIALARELGLQSQQTDNGLEAQQPIPNFQELCGVDPSLALVPFKSTIHYALEAWVYSRQTTMWPTLRSYLIEKCQLLRVLNDLKVVYLCADGTVFDTLLDICESRLHSGTNHFLLESLIRTTFAENSSVNSRSLSLDLSEKDLRQKGLRRLESLRLNLALPWPIANIIRPASMATYQRASHVLLQLRRAISSLSELRLRAASTGDSPSRAQHHRTVLQLRHRLTYTLSTTLEHLTQQVIEIAFHKLKQDTETANGFDSMIEGHAAIVESLELGCLLTPTLNTAREALVGICNIAVLFSESGTRDSEGIDSTEEAHSKKSHHGRIRQTQKQLAQLIDVLVRELRSASRTEKSGASAGWESLAQSLEWSAPGSDVHI